MREHEMTAAAAGLDTRDVDGADPLADALRERGRRRRGEAPAGLDDRILAAWRVDDREQATIRVAPSPAIGVGRYVTAAACVLLVGAAAMLARVDRAETSSSPAAAPVASVALSSGLRALPRPVESLARLASMPLRREAVALKAGTRRVLGGLDLLPRPRASN